MTHANLLAALRSHDALLVHCSRPGKGQDPKERVYPDDLQNAIQVLDRGIGTLPCSLIWPAHQATYGSVGIVIKPRTFASVKGVVTGDGGTTYDDATGERSKGRTVLLTMQNLPSAFTPTGEHNEWTVADADCVGIYFAPGRYAQVAERTGPLGPDAKYPTNFRNLTMDDVRKDFPGLPIFSIVEGRVLGFVHNPY